MEENRYFRTIWRINGVAIMLLVLFAIGAGVYIFSKEILHRNVPPVIKNVAEDPQGEEKWSLGSPREVDGTPFIYIPLVSEKKEISIPHPGFALMKVSGHNYFSPSRNLLFVNRETREMRWLFRDNKQLIANIEMLSVSFKRYALDRKTDAILYQVIRNDTNGDKKLNSEDLADVGISLPDGSQYKDVLQSVEHIFAAMSLGGRDVLILHQSNGKGYASTIRLVDMSVQSINEMPKIQEK